MQDTINALTAENRSLVTALDEMTERLRVTTATLQNLEAEVALGIERLSRERLRASRMHGQPFPHL